jgi:hypothetical protein
MRGIATDIYIPDKLIYQTLFMGFDKIIKHWHTRPPADIVIVASKYTSPILKKGLHIRSMMPRIKVCCPKPHINQQQYPVRCVARGPT